MKQRDALLPASFTTATALFYRRCGGPCKYKNELIVQKLISRIVDRGQFFENLIDIFPRHLC